MIVEAMADAQWKCLRTLRIADNNNTEKLQYNRENLKKWKCYTYIIHEHTSIHNTFSLQGRYGMCTD